MNNNWIDFTLEKPNEFVSVLGHMTDAGDLPSVRECYLVCGIEQEAYFPALQEFHPISHWMYMPNFE